MAFESDSFLSCFHSHNFQNIPQNILLYTYRDLRAKKHRDKNSLFALEKPADWSYDFFTSEKRRIDALIGYIVIFTSEKNRTARSPLHLIDKQHISKSLGAFFSRKMASNQTNRFQSLADSSIEQFIVKRKEKDQTQCCAVPRISCFERRDKS